VHSLYGGFNFYYGSNFKKMQSEIDTRLVCFWIKVWGEGVANSKSFQILNTHSQYFSQKVINLFFSNISIQFLSKFYN